MHVHLHIHLESEVGRAFESRDIQHCFIAPRIQTSHVPGQLGVPLRGAVLHLRLVPPEEDLAPLPSRPLGDTCVRVRSEQLTVGECEWSGMKLPPAQGQAPD